MMIRCRSCNAEMESPAEWAGEPVQCPACREGTASIPPAAPGPAAARPVVVDSDINAYRLGMRVLGIVVLVLGLGLILMESSFLVRAHAGGYLSATWPHNAALALFALLYTALGVLSLRLYYWVAWALVVLFAAVTVYALVSPPPISDPTFKHVSIIVTFTVVMLAAIALLVALRGRKIRAAGYTGDGGPRAVTHSGAIAAAVAMSLLVTALVASFVMASAMEHQARSAPPRPQWHRVTIREGVFTVEMPGVSRNDDQTVDTPAGKIVFRRWVVTTGPVEYSAACVEYPDAILASMGTADQVFDGGRDAVIAQNKAKLLRDEKGTCGLYPKRTLCFKVANPDGAGDVTMIQVMVLAEGRMYMTQSAVVGEGNAQTVRDVARFHDSLDLSVK